MKKFHLEIILNSGSPNRFDIRTIEAEDVEIHQSTYVFYKVINNNNTQCRERVHIAMYPINNTIITKIEEIKT